MIKEYQINQAAKTEGQADLPSGWVLSVAAIHKTATQYILEVCTCVTQGGAATEPYENSGLRRVYTYDPSTNNSQSENLMLTNNFEAELDTWFGNANWAVL